MSKLVHINHEALHTIATEVTPKEFTDGTVDKIIKGLKKAIKTYNVKGYVAVAIAAPQIGVAKRIFMVEDHSSRPEDEKLPTIIAINPKILKHSKKKKVLDEGCLSVPDTYGSVERYCNVTFSALNEKGESFTRDTGGLLAQIIQHETDHLDGILFIDKAVKTWSKPDDESDKNMN